MKALFSITILVLLFSGCSTVKPAVYLPHFERLEPTNLSWTDMTVKGKNVHVLTTDEWNDVQIELINRRITGNTCIDIINNISEQDK